MKRSSRLRRAACACAVITAVVLGVCSPAAAASPATAGAYCVMDAQTGEVICQKNAYARMEMASTTKVMTALVALENAPLSLTVRITRAEAGTEGSSMYLRAGDVYTLEDLLLGMMLVSGNDAALAVARTVAGSEASFVRLMNEKAQEIGMCDTHFDNPHGLHSQQHYTSAYDLALLCGYAMQNAEFCRIVGCKSAGIKELTSGETRVMVNKNRFIYAFEGADGIKIGYTRRAGRCLCASAGRNGKRMICVLLNDADWFASAAELLEGAFRNKR